MKKGDILEGFVEYTNFPNKGYVHVEDKKIGVKGVIKGQKVQFRLKKNGAERAEGELKQVLAYSPDETECPRCPVFETCGGCFMQRLPYEKQLETKENHVRKLLEPVITNPDYAFLPIKGSPKVYEYRNKMEFSFGDEYKGGPMVLGLHKKNSMFDLVSAADCALVHEDVRKILKAVLEAARKSGLDFYHRMSGEGFFRHLLVRRAERTGDILVDLIHKSVNGTGYTKETDIGEEQRSTKVESLYSEIVSRLTGLELEGRIVGILHTANDAIADAIRNDGTEILYGTDYFTEELLGLRFKVSPFSFFQTNSLGAEVLYSTVRDFVGETKDKVIFDLYSGTGTIGQLLAPVAKKVVGIEIVEEAVIAARANAARNGLTNCEFIAGDVLKMIDEVTDRPDFIVLDPPREGINPKALPKIINYGVDRMVYISCKPTSLAGDLVTLQESGYKVDCVQTVDMFPGTVHVETVCLLINQNSKVKHHINAGIDAEDYYRINEGK